jgi:hypothetical protein
MNASKEWSPKIPFSFLYGKTKLSKFHSDEFLALCSNVWKNCTHQEVEGGHWLVLLSS